MDGFIPKMEQLTELDLIKQDFDLFEYIKDTNDEELRAIERSNGRIDFKICPKCGGKDHFSLYVNNPDGVDTFTSWTKDNQCFESKRTGAQAAGGTIIDYIAGIDEVSEKEAIQKVVRLFNEGKYKKSAPTGSRSEAQKKNRRSNDTIAKSKQANGKIRERMLSLLTEATKIYHQSLCEREDVRSFIREKWGLSDRIIDEEMIGFCPEWSTLSGRLEAKGFSKEEIIQSGISRKQSSGKVFDFFGGRIIFPYWLNGSDRVGYMSGRIFDQKKNPDAQKYFKLATIEGAIENRYLIGSHRSTGGDRLIVVEGNFDYLSARDRGFDAVAVGSTTCTEAILAHLAQVAQKYQTLYIVFDTDPNGAGQNGAKNLSIRLNKLSQERHEKILDIRIVTLPTQPGQKMDIADYFKDHSKDQFLNLLDQADPFQEKVTISEIVDPEEISRGSVAINPFNDRPLIDYLDVFFEEVENRSRLQAIRTGFQSLDNKLDGGIYSGLYTIGAISSLGKTTLIHQIADNVAASGHPVLFYSLEMSRFEMVAKSLSRETYKIDRNHAATTRWIMQGSYEHIDLMIKARKNYRSAAKHFRIVEGMFTTTIEKIRSDIKHIHDNKAEKPLVIVDYLQILKSEVAEQRRYSERQSIDHIVSELKRMTRDFDIPIIAISSFNRANYFEVVGLESFKESGAIEYTSDVILGLQLRVMKEASEANTKSKQREITEQAKGDIREIELKCLKNRNGVANFTQNFTFNARHNYFEEEFFNHKK